MKLILFVLTFLVVLFSNPTYGQIDDTMEFGVVAFFRPPSKVMGSVDLVLSINNIRLSNIMTQQLVYHKVYSSGTLLLKGEVPNQVGFVAQQENITVTPGDTLFVKISPATNGWGKGWVDIVMKSRQEFSEDIAKAKKLSVINTSENLALPYIAGSAKKVKSKVKDGTGFLFSKDGYLLTNYHVVEQSSTIRVSGVNGNHKSSLLAELVLKDEINDLAVLKLVDRILIDEVPVSFRAETLDLGENISVLGYPLIGSMGRDIKLTTGVISSKSGFEGNINSYQISAAVQPGNSGSPVFDKNGKVVGVVTSKHNQGENVSYAVKSQQILSLLNNLDEKVDMSSSEFNGLELSELIKMVQDNVVIIECE